MAGRFIKLYDKILQWEWYKNTNVKVLFLHLLLKANYKDLSFEGHKILRGQLVTSLPSLSAELGMSPKQIRGSLDHLIATGEVASKTFPRYRIITVIHYDDYQSKGSQEGSQTADEQAAKGQAEGRQTAGSGQAEGSQRAVSIEYIDNIEQSEKDRNIESLSSRESKAASRFTKPTKEEIFDFCLENKLGLNVDKFYNHYESNGWMVGKNKMKDWKAAVRYWVSTDKEQPVKQTPAPVKTVTAQVYTQRDYSDEDAIAWRRMLEENE